MVLRQEDFQITGDKNRIRQLHRFTMKLGSYFQLTDKRIILPGPGIQRGHQLCDDLNKMCIEESELSQDQDEEEN